MKLYGELHLCNDTKLTLRSKNFWNKIVFLPMQWHMYLVAHIRTFFGKITNSHFSHSYYKASLKKMIANVRRHNLKHDPRIALVQVLRASKMCTFSLKMSFDRKLWSSIYSLTGFLNSEAAIWRCCEEWLFGKFRKKD